MGFVTEDRWASRATAWHKEPGELFADTVSPAKGRGRPAVRLNLWGLPLTAWFGEGERWEDLAETTCREIDGGCEFDVAVGKLQIAHADQLGAYSPEHGGLKQTLILEAKPAELPIWRSRIAGAARLKWAYQPPLTPEEQQEATRPDWCVGSYAVFDGAAKVAHCPRPYAIDGNGSECWLNLAATQHDGDVMLAVSLAATEEGRDWWASAVAPIKIDPNMGYDTAGSTYAGRPANFLECFGSWAAAGTASTVYLYCNRNPVCNLTLGLYEMDGSLCRETAGGTSPQTAAWHSQALKSSYSLQGGKVYMLAECHDGGTMGRYCDADTNSLYGGGYANHTYSHGTLPNPAPGPFSHQMSRRYSVYVTYTASGGSTTVVSRRRSVRSGIPHVRRFRPLIDPQQKTNVIVSHRKVR